MVQNIEKKVFAVEINTSIPQSAEMSLTNNTYWLPSATFGYLSILHHSYIRDQILHHRAHNTYPSISKSFENQIIPKRKPLNDILIIFLYKFYRTQLPHYYHLEANILSLAHISET